MDDKKKFKELRNMGLTCKEAIDVLCGRTVHPERKKSMWDEVLPAPVDPKYSHAVACWMRCPRRADARKESSAGAGSGFVDA